MHRRTFLVVVPAALIAARTAQAHHGWSSFDETRPIYLEGVIRKVRWQNPHAEIMLEINQQPMPATALSLERPKQAANIDAAAVLAKATPPTRKDKVWEVEFAPITRMQAWNMAEPKIGDRVAIIGYTFKDEKGSATLRVEFWLRDGKLIPLRSAPA